MPLQTILLSKSIDGIEPAIIGRLSYHPQILYKRDTTVITPLRKLTKSGNLYHRQPEIEIKLLELDSLTPKERLAQCQIVDHKNPMYVPSECILHFVRAARENPDGTYYAGLYKVLIARVLKQLPKRTNKSDKEALSDALIRENALGIFCELLADDVLGYAERLDFYEVQFMRAVRMLRIDVYREVQRDDDGKESIDSEEENCGLKKEVEDAIQNYNPFDLKIISILDYRFELDSAIEKLPDLQKRILQMLKLEMPIDSIDPNIVTISKTLKKSEKTIRTHRDKAFEAIRRRLTRGEY